MDGFDVNVESSFAVVDGMTLSPGAAGATLSGKVVDLETGGSTLDIGTAHFALPTRIGVANNGSINGLVFTGGQSKVSYPSYALVGAICGTVMLLI